MSFTARPYDTIVRDLLTVVTGGTVRESLTAPPEGIPLVPEKLRDRPVRRVSNLEGFVRSGTGATARDLPYRFTAADFELVASSGRPAELDSIRFRDRGRRPIPGTPLTVNYYPAQTAPVPVNDLNVGSVTRTLIETVARELALSQLQLERIYDSAFIETATGPSLDKVVALIGEQRLPPTLPLVKLRFRRAAGAAGRITLPAGIGVTSDKGARYATVDTATMEPNELSLDVPAAAESDGTAIVDTGVLTRLEVLIAGVEGVSNPEPARRPSAPESDEALRRRARSAFKGLARGTTYSLEAALLAMPEVGAAAIVESPNGVAGEIRIDIAYRDDSPAAKARVRLRIDEVRAAGIRVIDTAAVRLKIRVAAALTLPGRGASAAERTAIEAGVTERLTEHLQAITPGGQVRAAKLSSLALGDPRVVDARLSLIAEGRPPADALQLDPGQMLELAGIDFAPASFEAGPGGVAAVASVVNLHLPVLLVGTVTLAGVTDAIKPKITAYLGSRTAAAPLTFDSLAAAIRDDARFALVRDTATIVVEAGATFIQITQTGGEYAPAAGETLAANIVDIVDATGQP